MPVLDILSVNFSGRKMKKGKFLLLLLVSTLLLVLPNGLYSAFDKDEPKYLEAAYEMVKSGDYITPYYNYEFRFDKPILTYWLIVLGYKFFGVGEFGGRFFVSIFGVLTVLLLYFWLSRWRDEEFGFWSSLVLLSLLDFIVMSSVAMPDIVLTFFISASLISFFEGYHRGNRNFLRLAFLFSGLATLTKGPVGLVLPGLVALVYLIVRRELLKGLKGIPWFSGFLIYFAVVLPWYGAVLEKHGYEFFKEFIIFHNIHRFTGKIPGHPTAWWYYLANYFWLYIPWVFFFPFALLRLLSKRRFLEDSVIEFSLVWFVVVVLFFQIAHTKLAHYLLPSFPPFAVITTWYLMNFKERLPAYLTAFYFTVLTVVGFVFWLYKGWPLVGALFLLPPLVSSWLALWSGRVLKPITVGFITGMLLFKWVTLPSLEPFRAKPKIGKEMREIKEKCRDCKFAFLNYTSPEIVFSFRGGKLEDLDASQVKRLLKGKKPVVIVTRKNRLKFLKGVNYYILDERKELLTKHSIVLISNRERFNGGD